jgi:hypothetical protein
VCARARARARGFPSCHLQVRQCAAALRQQLRDLPGLVQAGGSSAAAAGTNGSSSSSSSSADAQSPLVHLQLSPALVAAAGSRKQAHLLLQGVADRLLEKHGLLVATPRYSSLERVLPPPSIKLFVHVGLAPELVPKVAAAVKEAAAHVLGRLV